MTTPIRPTPASQRPAKLLVSRIAFVCACAFVLGLQGCGGGAFKPVVKSGVAQAVNLQDIRMWHAPQRSRIVFDMDKPAKFEVLTLDSPPRVVIDLFGVQMRSAIPPANNTGQFIRQIRYGKQKTATRMVFDLAMPVRYFIQRLEPRGKYQHRVVVDFYPKSAVVELDAPPPQGAKSKIVILVDAGHGGEDAGAVGKRTHEKKVVLQIAKKLKDHLNKQPQLRAELTRTGDYYIALHKRTRIARRRQADLFVSIHADAFKNKSARGASVYALSQRGASSETAKWLANKENASDLAGGVSLADKDTQLAGVLLDLSMSKTISESIGFGGEVLAELKKIGKVHSKRIEQAGFVVLKSPDIPSILVETAYITNPQEEKLLMNPKHQERIAAAIAAGISNYLKKNGSRYAIR